VEIITFLADDAGSDHSAMSPECVGAGELAAAATTARNSSDAAAAAALLKQRSSRIDSGVSELWTVEFKDMAIEKQIGEGSFGKVRPLAGSQAGRLRGAAGDLPAGGWAACGAGRAASIAAGYMPAWPPTLLFACLPAWLQVYLAKWRETTVAVKVLGNIGGAPCLDEEFPDAAAAKGHPLYESLQKVGGWMVGWAGAGAL
jgi:hypothetical protein